LTACGCWFHEGLYFCIYLVQLNDELAKAGVKPEYIGGHRVTDAATMAVAQRVFELANDELAGALKKAGLPVCQIKSGVFCAEVHDARLGLVGEIKSVKDSAVNAAIERGEIPVLTSLGVSATGVSLNINADVAARELSTSLRPMKVGKECPARHRSR
jgi:N-acetyl-gamma-glutamyl-phosphate reductase / acetylglutamate kinase